VSKTRITSEERRSTGAGNLSTGNMIPWLSRGLVMYLCVATVGASPYRQTMPYFWTKIKYNLNMDASAYVGPGVGSQSEGYLLPSSGSSSLIASIFLGYLVGTLWA
jgi:hypothetical protein